MFHVLLKAHFGFTTMLYGTILFSLIQSAWFIMCALTNFTYFAKVFLANHFVTEIRKQRTDFSIFFIIIVDYYWYCFKDKLQNLSRDSSSHKVYAEDPHYNNILVFGICIFLIYKTFVYKHTDTIEFMGVRTIAPAENCPSGLGLG